MRNSKSTHQFAGRLFGFIFGIVFVSLFLDFMLGFHLQYRIDECLDSGGEWESSGGYCYYNRGPIGPLIGECVAKGGQWHYPTQNCHLSPTATAEKMVPISTPE
jgi:hypothetical protein